MFYFLLQEVNLAFAYHTLPLSDLLFEYKTYSNHCFWRENSTGLVVNKLYLYLTTTGWSKDVLNFSEFAKKRSAKNIDVVCEKGKG
jgi:hypothetical protein